MSTCSFCPARANTWISGESDMMRACWSCSSQHDRHPGFLSFAERQELKDDARANRALSRQSTPLKDDDHG